MTDDLDVVQNLTDSPQPVSEKKLPRKTAHFEDSLKVDTTFRRSSQAIRRDDPFARYEEDETPGFEEP